MKRTAIIACCVWLAHPIPSAAHRLDEYLQATRIALADGGGVSVEIDLTPGVDAAARAVALIDTNRDGSLSPAEQQAYSTLVVRSVDLRVDKTSAPLALARGEYPTIAEMHAGVGTIRLTARATIPSASSPGAHELKYVNVHQPEMSVYLVNAIAPPRGFVITDQQRDAWQHQFTLGYRVEAPHARAWRIASGVGMAGLMMGALGWFRRSSSTTRTSHLG